MVEKKWYIARKKGQRWIAAQFEKKPTVKRGYEMRGPFRNLVECMIAVDKEKTRGKTR